MSFWAVFGVLLFLQSFMSVTQAGIYFPKRMYTFYIPGPLSQVDVIGVIYVGQNQVTDCDDNSVIITLSDLSENILVKYGNFQILMTVKTGVDLLNITDEATFQLKVDCQGGESPMRRYYEELLSTTIILKSYEINPSLQSWSTNETGVGNTIANDIKQDVCPHNSDLRYDLIENSKTGPLDVFQKYRKKNKVPDGVSIVLSSTSEDSEYFVLNATQQELFLLKSPDREMNETLDARITCHVIKDGRQDTISTILDLRVKIWDVDDNPPSSWYQSTSQLRTYSGEIINKTLLTTDYDSKAITDDSSYRTTTNDTSGFLLLGSNTYMAIPQPGRPRHPKSTLIRTVVEIRALPVSLPYVADVFIEDLHFTPNGTISGGKKAIHRFVFHPNKQPAPVLSKTRIKLNLDVAAAKYSLIAQMPGDTSSDVSVNKTRFDIVPQGPPSLVDVLAVTDEGDIYVSDTASLSSYEGIAPILAKVAKYENDIRVEEVYISIDITDNLRERRHQNCDRGCSEHSTEEACVTSCGYGSSTGRCSWREGEVTMSSNYSTCTPTLVTCPDGDCSELEMKDNLVCPQDCSLGTMTGQLFRWEPNGRGIYKAKGPCWCESDGARYCTCDPGLPVRRYNSSSSAGHIGDLDDEGQKGTFSNSVNDESDLTGCTTSCRAAIAGTLAFLIVVVLSVFLGWMAWRRRRRRQAMSLKHVNSFVSMAAIPSDYIVDDARDQRTHVQRQTSSTAANHWPNKIGLDRDVFEDKWEFPRRYLTLEHVIGEGEFGQVVRAQAFMLRGQEGNTTVAVKMLKPDASGAEYQDLVSEFQLLKEVDHPNVIKLLGVCTQKGPLHVIVEFCQLGSLRSFLRTSKFKNKGSWEEKQRNGNDALMSENTDSRILTLRDMFSFAWQIAKGMDYLSGLKIVHRDLAARNVLVTEGLKMKISDFGLSRDVYEADTYLKMSKGRIPVKWMAPESLYGQIYTTKSDIWSYGIVLWEIVTLGASPYPGIPPERLFPLLSTGYRMDRPDDCSEELYAIMQKCWKTEPENRPSFSMLRDILDQRLQQNTEYLELSDENYFTQSAVSDSNDWRSCQQSRKHDDSKHIYGNVCGINDDQLQPDVTTQCPAEDFNNVECPEMSKLLEKTDRGISHQSDDVLYQNDTSCPKRSGQVIVHENLTYV